MRRHFRVTFLIGTIVALAATLGVRLGLTIPWDRALCDFFGFRHALWQERQSLEFILILLSAYGIAWTTLDITRPFLKSVVAAAALLQVISLSWVLALYGYFFSPFAAGFVILGSFLVGIIYTGTEGGKRKRVLRSLFGDRLGGRYLNDIIDAREPPALQGAITEITLMYCRILPQQDFAETDDPATRVRTVNRAWETCSEYLVKQGAYLDACNGTTLRAVFGAPVGDEQHPAKACQAALEIRTRLRNLNADLDPGLQIDLRIGLQTGPVISGAFGTHRFGGFSVAGEAVDLARQICDANLIYGSTILTGPETYLLAQDHIEGRPIEFLSLDPEAPKLEIYELLGLKESLTKEELHRRDLFWEGLIYYRERRLDKALERFQTARDLNGNDAPLEFYIRRIQRLQGNGPSSEPSWKTARSPNSLD